MAVIAWDLDGTLIHSDRDLGDYTDPELVLEAGRPDWLLASILNVSRSLGTEVHVVTGRTPVLADATQAQLDHAGIHVDGIHHQPHWGGYEAMAVWKAGQLRDLGAEVYVGDHEADRNAADLAGIEFVNAEALRRVYGAYAATAWEG